MILKNDAEESIQRARIAIKNFHHGPALSDMEISYVKEELQSTMDQTLDMIKFAITVSGVILGFGITVCKDTPLAAQFILLLPLIILYCAIGILCNRKIHMANLSAYLKVFGESRIKWEDYFDCFRNMESGAHTGKANRIEEKNEEHSLVKYLWMLFITSFRQNKLTGLNNAKNHLIRKLSISFYGCLLELLVFMGVVSVLISGVFGFKNMFHAHISFFSAAASVGMMILSLLWVWLGLRKLVLPREKLDTIIQSNDAVRKWSEIKKEKQHQHDSNAQAVNPAIVIDENETPTHYINKGDLDRLTQ